MFTFNFLYRFSSLSLFSQPPLSLHLHLLPLSLFFSPPSLSLSSIYLSFPPYVSSHPISIHLSSPLSLSPPPPPQLSPSPHLSLSFSPSVYSSIFPSSLYFSPFPLPSSISPPISLRYRNTPSLSLLFLLLSPLSHFNYSFSLFLFVPLFHSLFLCLLLYGFLPLPLVHISSSLISSISAFFILSIFFPSF